MFPYQATHQLSAAAGSIKDLKYPSFDITTPNDLSSKTVRPFENLTLPVPTSFLASFPAPGSSLIKPANGLSGGVGSAGSGSGGLANSNGVGGGGNLPIKGLYIIDQNKNIRKLTLPANPAAAWPGAGGSPATSSPPGLIQQQPDAALLLSSLIHSTTAPMTPNKTGQPGGFVATPLADLYAGSMLNVVRKRRKQDLSSPLLPSPTQLLPACVTKPGATGSVYPFPAAMTDLTNSNGHLSLLASPQLVHHAPAGFTLAKPGAVRSLSPVCQPPNQHLQQHHHEFSTPCEPTTTYMNGGGADLIHHQLNGSSGDYLNSLLNDADAFLDDETLQSLSKEFRYVGSNGLSWSAKKCKSHVAIAKSYKPTWKSRSHHYQKYSDIKAKDAAGRTPASSISVRELDESLSEWKLHYVIGQVNSLMSYETESMSLINDVEAVVDALNKCAVNRDLFVKLNDSIKANTQRHRYVSEQLEEAHLLIHKLFEHKEKFKNVLIESAVKSSAGEAPANGAAAEPDETPEPSCEADENGTAASSTTKQPGGKLSSSLRKSLKKSMSTRLKSKKPS